MLPIRPKRLLLVAVPLVIGLLVTISHIPSSKARDARPEGDASEEEDMISLLDQAATMRLEAYNPAYVMQAVNALHPLGKEQALAQVASYLQKRDKGTQATGLFWVLRVLFEVPDEPGFPPVRLGQPTIPPPIEAGHLPRFPIVMVQDIPFLAVRGYFLAGMPEPVEAHLDYYSAHGTLRPAPLVLPPTVAGVEEEFLREWDAAYGERYEQEALATLREQLARLHP